MQSENRKIFICIPWFTPAFRGGGPIQSVFNLVERMQGLYDFFIFTADSDLDGSPLQEITSNAWIPFNKTTRVFYSVKKQRTKILLKEIKSIMPDKIFVIGVFDWAFNIFPVLFSPVPVIISARGMLHKAGLAYKPLKKKIFLSLFKFLRLNVKHSFHATDEYEAGEIRNAIGANTRVFVAGNFPRKLPFIQRPKQEGVLKMITIALVGPMKNHLVVIQSLKYVKTNVAYHIYGPIKEPGYWEACLQEKDAIAPNASLVYHGELNPGKVPQTLAEADLFIMPSRTENFGHSIIEALLSGVPVITSSHVPWLQLEKEQAGINVEAEPLKLADAIDRFARMDNSTFQRWKQGARSYAEAHIHIPELMNQYHLIFN